jgi:protein SCO1/2
MTDRRRILTRLAAGAAALPSLALGAEDPSCECAPPRGGPHSEYFPNVVVHTHEGRRALFYNDLLRGKTVLVNCMSVAGESQHRPTANLLRVQRALGERVGRDVFIYSITVEPERDTPRALAAFAEAQGVGDGWLFLTGKPDVIHALRERLFADRAAPEQTPRRSQGHAAGHAHNPAREDCSLGLVRYGNEAVGLWGSVPAQTETEWIVRRLSWVESRKPPAGPFKRRGPAPAITTKEVRR